MQSYQQPPPWTQAVRVRGECGLSTPIAEYSKWGLATPGEGRRNMWNTSRINTYSEEDGDEEDDEEHDPMVKEMINEENDE